MFDVTFYVDSGAGQCMCSCIGAFSCLRPCAILVVGVSGSLPVHGVGTANFLVADSDGVERIWRIHNCLLCHKIEGEEDFNLLSVSQLLRTKMTNISFGNESSSMTLKSKKRGEDYVFPFKPVDGLYSVSCVPISENDLRFGKVVCLEVTPQEDPMMSAGSARNDVTCGMAVQKSPSSLGMWTVKVLWVGKSRTLAAVPKGFGEDLDNFCSSYIAPLSIPKARKSYQTTNADDMSDLSVRFLGIGTERLQKTLERSIGLSPMQKVKGKMRHPVPTHNFPQGQWKKGKTPKVSKGIIHDLHRASIGEVVFMDTFEVEDSGYVYAQAFLDYRSKYGEVIPLKSRTQVGWSFAEFCARHFIPLILIRDNIAENTGGNLMQECQKRSVKSAFICPYRKQQNYAEGYIGRITSLASFGMVYAGAPMFMWRWCVACAVFINNITATFYSEENLWATPYEVVHNEPYPDSSVVVPFGCGVLVRLRDEEQSKFIPKCALMIFIHYATQHPLYTYAVYSPRTKRVLFRQDCIFLTNLFPMRAARTKNGLSIEGDVIIPYRSPSSLQAEEDQTLSFQDWTDSDPLPDFQDHVSGYKLNQPVGEQLESALPRDSNDFVFPDNPAFGPPSVVKTRGVPKVRKREEVKECTSDCEEGIQDGNKDDADKDIVPTKRVNPKRNLKANDPPLKPTTRRPAKQRWFYEPVSDETTWDGTIAQQEKLDTYVRIRDEMAPILVASVVPTQTSSTGEEGKESSSIYNHLENDDYWPEELMDLGLGELKVFSRKDMDEIPVNEHGASLIQGLVFHDQEFSWCRITGWGIECGMPIVFYSKLKADGHDAEEEQFVSLTELKQWMNMSYVPVVTPMFEPSRLIKRSEDLRKTLCYRQLAFVSRSSMVSPSGVCNGPLVGEDLGSYDGKSLTKRTIRRILKAQETIFKYGTMIPRNDAEAARSPEAARWQSGKQLEWLRLKLALTFETNWTWALVREHFPDYKKTDIGHLFFIYDYKFSGEHRVRLVFDGSRQSDATYNETYAPTVRPESVRLFHVYAVEYAWPIQQYDVPQAFLRSDADCDIFVSPPNGFAEFPGQLLKLSKMLYGSKQAAALWYNLINGFLMEIGFVSSTMDPCFYRRPITGAADNDACADAIIILHVDDMRVAASASVLTDIHARLYSKFEITTSDTGRFLGMDTEYDLDAGLLRMHMQTYIESTVDRFMNFDVSQGVPFREIVGSLLWIVLCIHGPELLRVKDLARKSNNFTADDYAQALKVLQRLVERKDLGIIYRKGGAGKETVPANTRLGGVVEDPEVKMLLSSGTTLPYSTGDFTSFCELKENDLYKLDFTEDVNLDIKKMLAPTNNRFTVVSYADASFAVGEQKQSISGILVMINGTPILWGSLKQTAVVDATCSAEYVASSICCKQILQAENMVQFLNFTCPKPYTLYTDSQACMHIANTESKLGKVRHVEIRYHLVRCLVIAGDIRLIYCITEDMIADIFTKIVAGAQDKRLSIRFYNDCDILLFEKDINKVND